MHSTSSIAVSAVTVPRATDAPRTGLGRRVASAVLLAAFGGLAIYTGGRLFQGAVLLAAAVLMWEWTRLEGGPAYRAWAAAVVLPAALGAGMVLGPFSLAFGLVVACAVVWLALGLVALPSARWIALGTFYVGAWAVAAFWLRAEPTGGREAVFWLIAVCIATDTGAYFVGRAVGGPLLAPRISPNKTWAGSLGGLLCAAAVGFFAARLMRGPDPLFLVLVSVGVSVAAQLGDLAESAAKRHFGVKDSGRLIPGHGGLFDRFDSIVGATLAVAVATIVVGRSVVLW